MLKKSYLLYLIIFVLLVAGFILLARPGSRPGKSVGNVTTGAAGEMAYDFGSIRMNAGLVSHVYQIKNTNSDDLTITNIYTSCMCTNAYFLKDAKRVGPFGMPGHAGSSGPAIREILAPGGTAQVEVVFDPAAHGPAGLGKVERMVTVETLGHEPVQMQFTAEVTP